MDNEELNDWLGIAWACGEGSGHGQFKGTFLELPEGLKEVRKINSASIAND